MILYNDIDPFCCAVLRERVRDGGLPPGDVLEADVRTLTAETLAPYTQVHLFAGIGGSPLGFKWAGWPADWPLVTGGFPCQDISAAGKGAGLDGDRSGLFWEMHRVIEIKRPIGVLAENVGALSTRGLDRVVGALGSLGYDIHALRVGAWAVGSPQQRERWWIVALLHGAGCGQGSGEPGDQAESRRGRDQSGVALGDASGSRRSGGEHQPKRRSTRGAASGRSGASGQLDVTDCERHQRARGQQPGRAAAAGASTGVVLDDAQHARLEGHQREAGQPQDAQPWNRSACRFPHPRWEDADGNTIPTPQHAWEPPRLYTRGMAGLSHGISARLASSLNKRGVEATGNAQVPQCVECVARGMIAALRG